MYIQENPALQDCKARNQIKCTKHFFFSQGRRVLSVSPSKGGMALYFQVLTLIVFSITSEQRIYIQTSDPSDLWRAGQVLYNSIHVQLNILHRFTRKALTQWSRACRKSNSSSVQSSAVFGRELTRASHASSLCRVCTQCSVPSHVCLTVSNGSWSHRDTVSVAPGVI